MNIHAIGWGILAMIIGVLVITEYVTKDANYDLVTISLIVPISTLIGMAVTLIILEL